MAGESPTIVVSAGVVIARPQALHLRAQVARLEAVPQRDAQRVEVERLREVVEHAQLERRDGLLDASMGRHHDDHRVRIDRADLPQHVNPGLIGQLQVEQHEIGQVARERLEPRLAVGGLEHVVVPRGEMLAHRPPLERVVVDDEDAVPGHPVRPRSRRAR